MKWASNWVTAHSPVLACASGTRSELPDCHHTLPQQQARDKTEQRSKYVWLYGYDSITMKSVAIVK